jgi:prepilin-type N-terminal cleavage/methylation domain-containing protein
MYYAIKIKFAGKMCLRNRTERNRGFTLVELLVVISIIALLLAVLIPAMSKAKRLAQRTVCMTHVQQLIMAGMVYSQNNDGKFPHQYADSKTNHRLIKNPLAPTVADAEDSWIRHIFPYVKKLEHFRCPANNGNNAEDTSYPPNDGNDFSYTCNGVVAHFSGVGLKRPSKMIVYYDDPGRSNMSIVRPFYNSSTDSVIAMIKTGRYWSGWMRWKNGDLQNQYHDGGKCFSFMDGHVQYAKWKDVTSMWFGLLVTDSFRKYIDGQEPDLRYSDYNDDRRTGAIKW